MGMSRKDYVLQVTETIKENVNSVLQGHSLKPNYLELIGSRPDAIAKLALFAWNSKLASKGKNALKRSKNFKISAYKNFVDFNFKARQDVELFMSRLSPADAETFKNDENIVTILVLPDTETGNMANDITDGKSVVIPFQKSVLNDYKIPGGIYITVMFGDSYILPATETKALAREKINKRIVEKTKSAGKIRQILKQKANAKLAALEIERKKLELSVAKTSIQLQQVNSLGKMVGATSENPNQVIKAIKAYDQNNIRLIRGLDAFDKDLYNKARVLLKKGKTVAANRLLEEIGLPEVTILAKSAETSDVLIKERAKNYRKKIKALNDINAKLLIRLETATTAKAKADTRFAIKKNAEKINLLRTRIGAFSKNNMKINTLKSKSKMLAAANKDIADNLAKGASIQSALQMALAKLPVTSSEKQQIRQQIIQQVANEQIPMQYAVQQAIQNVVATTDEFEDVDNSFEEEEDLLDASAAYADPLYNENFEDEEDLDLDADLADEFSEEEFDSISSSLVGKKSISDILSFL